MKKEKLSLDDLVVKSFITEGEKSVQGGYPFCVHSIDLCTEDQQCLVLDGDTCTGLCFCVWE